MAFESLSEKLQNVFKNLRGKGRLTEDDVRAGLKEVRLALLEADVSFKVVKQFISSIQERAVGSEVLESLTPGQQVIKIVHEELIKLGQIGGQNIIKNKYEGIYVLENEDIRKQFFDKGGNLRLDKLDPENLRKIENSKKFKEGVEEVRKKSQEYYLKNKNIIKTEAIAKINTVVELAGDTDIFTDNDLKFALGKTTITSRIIIDRGVPYLRYNITDKFQDPADINIEWGKQYQMLGPSRIIPLFDVMGLEK